MEEKLRMPDSDRGQDVPRTYDDVPLNPPDVPIEEKGRELLGLEEHDDQDAVFAASDVGDRSPGLTGDELYEGYLEAGHDPSGDDSVDVLVQRELRSGETDDPNLAAEEGLAYVPPVDPVVVPDPGNPEGVQVAAGTGTSALDEAYDADHHDSFLSGEDEMSDRVREALRADAATSRYAEQLGIETEAGVVTLRGTVDDIDDSDAVAEVASRVTGVDEVRDDTRVRGL
jgi:hypothetical protein